MWVSRSRSEPRDASYSSGCGILRIWILFLDIPIQRQWVAAGLKNLRLEKRAQWSAG
jgi:hypothetical protein